MEFSLDTNKLPNMSQEQMLMSYEFLSSYGCFDKVHINELIINTLVIEPKLKNVEFLIDKKQKKIDAILHLSFWGLLFYKKSKIIENLKFYYARAKSLESYRISFRFKKYRQING